jgi:hypothetical protein
MSYVKVTFKLEVTDPGDATGLNEADYDVVMEQVPLALGGYDVEVEKVDD